METTEKSAERLGIGDNTDRQKVRDSRKEAGNGFFKGREPAGDDGSRNRRKDRAGVGRKRR